MLVRWIGIVGSLVLALGGTPVAAQSADAYFHDAAQQYVAGNEEAARQAVERGLEVAPSDPRLQALRKKLNQKSQDRGGGGSKQGAPKQPQDGQSEGKEGEKAQSKASGEKAQDQQASDPQSPQSQRAGGGGRAGGRAPRSGAPPIRDGESKERNALTRAQAARLLRALQNQEMKLLREVQGQASETVAVEKDW